MTAQINRDKLRVGRIVFKAHYEGGLRLLTESGNLLARMRNESRSWEITRLATGSVSLQEKAKRIVANITIDAVDATMDQPGELKDVGEKVTLFAESAQWLYESTISEIRAPKTLRIGAFFSFFAPADTSEECDRWSWRVAKSPFQEWVQLEKNWQPLELIAVHYMHDPDSGLHRSFSAYSAIANQPAGALPPMGFRNAEGQAGLAIDVDSYFRPDKEERPNLLLFIQTEFDAVSRIVPEVLRKSFA